MYWKVKHWRFLEWVRSENLKSLATGSSLKFEAERLAVMYCLYLTDSLCHTSLQGQIELVPLGPYKYHLRIFCKKAGVFTKVLEALCSYNAQVTSLNTITYYGYAESVFTIEVNCLQKTCLHAFTDLLDLPPRVFWLLKSVLVPYIYV